MLEILAQPGIKMSLLVQLGGVEASTVLRHLALSLFSPNGEEICFNKAKLKHLPPLYISFPVSKVCSYAFAPATTEKYVRECLLSEVTKDKLPLT